KQVRAISASRMMKRQLRIWSAISLLTITQNGCFAWVSSGPWVVRGSSRITRAAVVRSSRAVMRISRAAEVRIARIDDARASSGSFAIGTSIFKVAVIDLIQAISFFLQQVERIPVGYDR